MRVLWPEPWRVEESYNECMSFDNDGNQAFTVQSMLADSEASKKEWGKKWGELRRQYDSYLEEYHWEGSGEWSDFPDKWPDEGWKFHLNVAPEKVVKVATFLKDGNFKHKFLSGGEIEDGKIFTVYTGSKIMTEKAVVEIVDNVGNLLEEPRTDNEVKFSKRIVGRFEGDVNSFNRKAAGGGVMMARERPEINLENIEYAKKVLWEKYGDYFGGGINYYDPKVSKDNAIVDLDEFFNSGSKSEVVDSNDALDKFFGNK